MVPKFANVYTFKNHKTGEEFIARWDVLDGAQAGYTGPSANFDFVSAELNVPDGERSEAEAAGIGNSAVALPEFISRQRVKIIPA